MLTVQSTQVFQSVADFLNMDMSHLRELATTIQDIFLTSQDLSETIAAATADTICNFSNLKNMS